jgi:hypothetical protein
MNDYAVEQDFPHWQLWLISIISLIILFLALYQYTTAIAIMVVVLVLQTATMYVKGKIGSLPIEFGFLHVGAALLASVYSIGLALLMALLARFIEDAFRSKMDKRGWQVIISVIITTIVAKIVSLVMPVSLGTLFFAVLIGQIVRFAITKETDVIAISVVKTVTDIAFAAVLIFFFLPNLGVL